MSEGLNMVHLFGNLGADPELTQTSGGALLRIRLATTFTYLDKDKTRQEKTEWHTVKMFGTRAEGLAKILTKGSRLYISGHLQHSSYEKNGEKRYATDIIADKVILGGPRPNDRPVTDPRPREVLQDLPF